MEGTYQVFLGGSPAGKVQLIRQGLYYQVFCHCRIQGELVYRLYAQWDNRRENLGVVVPDGDGFTLNKKIPAKRFETGEVRFVLSAGTGMENSKFVPISPEEPFAYIDRLKTAFLATENGRIGLRIQENPGAD